MYQEPIWYTTPILLEADSILCTDNKKFLVDLEGSQRLASQSYLEREGTHNTTYLILCYNVHEKYITLSVTLKSLNIALWPWKLCSQKLTFLCLSHAYSEIFPIYDNSAVYKDTDSQETSAEHSKEVSLGGKKISMQCVQPMKALISIRCTPACQQFAAFFLQYCWKEFLSQ